MLETGSQSADPLSNSPVSFGLVHPRPEELQNDIDLIEGETGLKLVGILRTGQECIDLIRRQAPDALIISLDLADMNGIELAQMIETSAPQITVILELTGKENEETWHEILRAGVRDFLFQPFNPDDLISVLNRAVASKKRLFAQVTLGTNAQQKSNCQTILFTTPCRGTGQTTLAVNTAHCLARQGRTALLDLHLPVGDVAIHFDTHPTRTIADLLNAYGGVDQALLEAVLEETPSGVHVLAAPTTPFSSTHEQLDLGILDQLMHALRASFQFIIIDAPSPETRETQLLLTHCQRLIATATGDLPRLLQLKTALSAQGPLFHHRDIITPVVLLGRKYSVFLVGDIPQLVGHPHPTTLPFDHPTATRAINVGKPICSGRTKRGLAGAINRWVKGLGLVVPPKN
ncbi:MAG: response regulator [Verrucomicrobiota bacterium]|nr:response regulator [Verrucomicrobiota bacterium]